MIPLEMPDGLHDGLQVLFGGGVAHLGQDVLPEKKTSELYPKGKHGEKNRRKNKKKKKILQF